jgi:ketosteroid isomerase-like protein
MSNPAEDELAIRHLVAAYADAVNRRDGPLWASTWADDGVWDLMGNEITGKDAVVDMWNNAMNGFEFVVQLVYQGTLEIDGASATGRWLFTRRTYNVLYNDEGKGDMSGMIIPMPA